MKYLWITDPHFDKCHPDGAKAFGSYLVQEGEFDGVIISGDIGESNSFDYFLEQFAEAIAPRPCLFVLGNHDYYRGSFEDVRKRVRELRASNLVWLDESKPIIFDDDTSLVGHQGWFDGRCGNPEKTRINLWDFEIIRELNEVYHNEQTFLHYGREALLAKLRELGEQFAQEAKPNLYAALAVRKQVIFITHFPPYQGAAWHRGEVSDNHWLPWFTNISMGEMLAEAAHSHPDNKILVLCGHSHSPGTYDHLPNLRVLTGRAVYGAPDVCGILESPLKW